MICFDHVTKRYEGGTHPAVDDLSLEIPEGQTVVLIGPSGCGKSTTLRMVNRLIEPESGTVSEDGRDVRDFPPEELRRHVGYAIQGVGLFPHYTVAENIGVVPRLLDWDAANASTSASPSCSISWGSTARPTPTSTPTSSREARLSAWAWPGRLRPTRRFC